MSAHLLLFWPGFMWFYVRLLQHTIEGMSLSRTNCQSHSHLAQMFLFSELTGTTCTPRSPWRSGPAQTEEGGIPHLTSGTRRLQEQGWSRMFPKWRFQQRTTPKPLGRGHTGVPNFWKWPSPKDFNPFKLLNSISVSLILIVSIKHYRQQTYLWQ